MPPEMTHSLLELTPEQLPEHVPVFPLEQAVLFPHCQLPLNIFEPRYIHMVLDALGHDRLIGMIQPRADRSPRPLYQVGCAGKIVCFEETDDGRLLIVLRAVSRFRVVEELATDMPYRKAQISWSEFSQDMQAAAHQPSLERAPLLKQVKQFATQRGLEVQWGHLEQVSEEVLINVLCSSLPLDVADKQALLETADLRARYDMLNSLLRMEMLIGSDDEMTSQ